MALFHFADLLKKQLPPFGRRSVRDLDAQLLEVMLRKMRRVRSKTYPVRYFVPLFVQLMHRRKQQMLRLHEKRFRYVYSKIEGRNARGKFKR